MLRAQIREAKVYDFGDLTSKEARRREKLRVLATLNDWPREARHGPKGVTYAVQGVLGDWLPVGEDWNPLTRWGKRCVEKGRMLKPPRPRGRLGK